MVGLPRLYITYTGADSARKYDFAFTNCKGQTGAQGAKGPTGASGNALGSITRYVSSTYLLNSLTTYTNGTSSMAACNSTIGYNYSGWCATITNGIRLLGEYGIGISGTLSVSSSTSSTYRDNGVYMGLGYYDSSTAVTAWPTSGVAAMNGSRYYYAYTHSYQVAIGTFLLKMPAYRLLGLLAYAYSNTVSYAAQTSTYFTAIRYA